MKTFPALMSALALSLAFVSSAVAETRTEGETNRLEQEAQFQANNAAARPQLSRKERVAKAVNRRAEQKIHPDKRPPDKMDIGISEMQREQAKDKVELERSGTLYETDADR